MSSLTSLPRLPLSVLSRMSSSSQASVVRQNSIPGGPLSRFSLLGAFALQHDSSQVTHYAEIGEKLHALMSSVFKFTAILAGPYNDAPENQMFTPELDIEAPLPTCTPIDAYTIESANPARKTCS